ncbi:MAG: hypothetical protein IJK27_01290 [Bacilli bacterium]|nr:hypothetical protein [Bacilli bacterium]
MNKRLEERRMVYGNKLIKNVDEFIINLISNAEKQILVTDSGIDNFLIKYLSFAKEDVQVYIVASFARYEEVKLEHYIKLGIKANYLIDDNVKDNILIIDQKKTYNIGIANNTGEEILVLHKFNDSFIGDIILNRYGFAKKRKKS